MYKFTEIFTTPEEALNKTKEEQPKFTILNHKVDRVNVKPIKEDNIERGKKNVQSTKNIATMKNQQAQESRLMNKYKRLVVQKKNTIADLGNKLVIEQGKNLMLRPNNN